MLRGGPQSIDSVRQSTLFALIGAGIFASDLARGGYRVVCMGRAFWPVTDIADSFSVVLVFVLGLAVWQVDKPLERTGVGGLLAYELLRAYYFVSGHPQRGWIRIIALVAAGILIASNVRTEGRRGALLAGIVLVAWFMMAWAATAWAVRSFDAARPSHSVLHSAPPGC